MFGRLNPEHPGRACDWVRGGLVRRGAADGAPGVRVRPKLLPRWWRPNCPGGPDCRVRLALRRAPGPSGPRNTRIRLRWPFLMMTVLPLAWPAAGRPGPPGPGHIPAGTTQRSNTRARALDGPHRQLGQESAFRFPRSSFEGRGQERRVPGAPTQQGSRRRPDSRNKANLRSARSSLRGPR